MPKAELGQVTIHDFITPFESRKHGIKDRIVSFQMQSVVSGIYWNQVEPKDPRNAVKIRLPSQSIFENRIIP
jgi:hypothetical protein